VKLHQARAAAGVDQPEGVNAEAFHHAVAARDGAIPHHPHHHVSGLGHERDEVPERVVRRLRLRDLVGRLRLDRVDDVGELDAVLDEEHRHVVADQVEVALGGVEFGREAADVAHGVRRAARAGHGGEPDEHRRLDRRVIEEPRARQFEQRLVELEVTVRAGAARVDHALGDPLMIEVRDLLAKVKVLDQRRGAYTGLGMPRCLHTSHHDRAADLC
jgi:hypothetical protein